MHRYTPEDVTGITNAIDVSAGNTHTCAVLADGSVRCWGHGGNGQMGNGTTTGNNYIPVPVSNITNAVSIDVGSYFSCALLADGTIACWGNGGNGRLRSGMTGNQLLPVSVSTITDAQQITTGDRHACAVLSDRSVSCWGYASSGQLGDGVSINSQLYPVEVAYLDGVHSVSAGGEHSCAVLQNGTVKCWGRGNYGQMGNGTNTTYNFGVVAVSGFGQQTPSSAGASSTPWSFANPNISFETGNVGIGTAALPDAKLHVDQTGTSITDYAGSLLSSARGLLVEVTSVLGGVSNYFEPDYPNIFAKRASSTRGANIAIGNTSGFYNLYASNSAFQIYSPSNKITPSIAVREPSNYVGINTKEPSAQLDVNGDVNVSGALNVDGGRISSSGDICIGACGVIVQQSADESITHYVAEDDNDGLMDTDNRQRGGNRTHVPADTVDRAVYVEGDGGEIPAGPPPAHEEPADNVAPSTESSTKTVEPDDAPVKEIAEPETADPAIKVDEYAEEAIKTAPATEEPITEPVQSETDTTDPAVSETSGTTTNDNEFSSEPETTEETGSENQPEMLDELSAETEEQLSEEDAEVSEPNVEENSVSEMAPETTVEPGAAPEAIVPEFNEPISDDPMIDDATHNEATTEEQTPTEPVAEPVIEEVAAPEEPAADAAE